MRDVVRKLRHKDVGSIGIGAMIVFIAMVLVAGIAASVLIQTSTRLEAQAMASGQETIAEVSTGIAVFDIAGYASSDLITNLTITVRPRSGSQDIDLNETFIEISDTDQKIILSYNGSDDGWNDSDMGVDDIFGNANLFPDANRFGIMVLEDADDSCSQDNPVINKGDKVLLAIDTTAIFTTNGGIPVRTNVWGTVVSEDGSPGVISFTSPASYGSSTHNLFDLQ